MKIEFFFLTYLKFLAFFGSLFLFITRALGAFGSTVSRSLSNSSIVDKITDYCLKLEKLFIENETMYRALKVRNVRFDRS